MLNHFPSANKLRTTLDEPTTCKARPSVCSVLWAGVWSVSDFAHRHDYSACSDGRRQISVTRVSRDVSPDDTYPVTRDFSPRDTSPVTRDFSRNTTLVTHYSAPRDTSPVVTRDFSPRDTSPVTGDFSPRDLCPIYSSGPYAPSHGVTCGEEVALATGGRGRASVWRWAQL